MNIVEVQRLLNKHGYETSLRLRGSIVELTFPNIVESNKIGLVKNHTMNLGKDYIIVDGNKYQIPNYAIRQSIVGSIVLQCNMIGYNPALTSFYIDNDMVEETHFFKSLPIELNDDEREKENILYKIIAQYILTKLYNKEDTTLITLAKENGVIEGFNSIVRFLDYFS